MDRRVMRAAINFVTQRGQPLLCLLGPEYYPRFGFEPARGIGIEPPKLAVEDRAGALASVE